MFTRPKHLFIIGTLKVLDFAFRLIDKIGPSQGDIVKNIVRGTANLQLTIGEYVDLKIVPGMYGRVTLTGNSLPRFEYWIFDGDLGGLMEFVCVKAELSLPDRILFSCSIREDGGELIEVEFKEEYKLPFMVLARHLSSYFPLEISREKGLKGFSYVQKEENQERQGEEVQV